MHPQQNLTDALASVALVWIRPWTINSIGLAAAMPDAGCIGHS